MPAVAKVTPLRVTYPKTEVEEPKRPYRLWDANKKKMLPWRFYGDPKRAHMGALMETAWSAVGTTVEVFDARTAACMGQYTHKRRDDGKRYIDFWRKA